MRRVRRRSNRGFALVTVLVIMLAGMALLGAAFYLHGSFVGRSIMSIRDQEIDNFADEGIELGKTMLMEQIDPNDAAKTPPAHISSDIGERDDLIALDNQGKEMRYERKNITAADGKKYDLIVEIFDLDYRESDLKAGITEAERAQLPPMVRPQGRYRTYLIASTMLLQPAPQSGGTVTEIAVSVRVEP